MGRTAVYEIAEITEAFRRLSQRWQGLTVASNLRDVHGQGQRALQAGVDAYTTQAQGNVPNAPALVDQTRAQIQEALGQARKAAGEPG